MDDNPNFRAQLHSYALSRIMKHLIGYENFQAPDHAVHQMLIEDVTTKNQSGNFNDALRVKIESVDRVIKEMGETK